jgi:hypothetical protein
MSNLLAKTALTLVASTGLFQPSTKPSDAPDLAKLLEQQQRIHQLNLDIQKLNSQLNQIQTMPVPQLSLPAPILPGGPLTLPLPPRGLVVQPYGPSFQFNGLRVYVEPIATASANLSSSAITGEQVLGTLHPLAGEAISFSPARKTTTPATHP